MQYTFCPKCNKVLSVHNTFAFLQPVSTPYPLSVEFCTCQPMEMVDKTSRDAVYTERNKCVALLVSMALGLGLKAGIGLHEDKEGEEWEDDWRHIAFIDLPSGQVSWHLHDSEMAWFEGAPKYTGKWDGHTFDEKYSRVLEMCKYPDDEE